MDTPPRHSYNPVTCDDAILNSCIMCKNEGKMKCSRCGTKYCSIQCQAQDWRHHQPLCRNAAYFAADRRPTPRHYRIILFPTELAEPQFSWIEASADGSGPTAMSTVCLLGVNGGCIRELNDDAAAAGFGPPLRVGRGLRALMPGHGPRRPPGLRLNRSVLGLARPGHIRVVYGAVAFCAFTRPAPGSDCSWEGLELHDASLRDLRSAVDFLLFQQADCVGSAPRFRAVFGGARGPVWPAVKINCKADVARYGRAGLGFAPDAIEAVLVPAEPVRNQRRPSGWAARLGLSWLWQRASVLEDLEEEARFIWKAPQNFDGRLFVIDPDEGSMQVMARSLLEDVQRHGACDVPLSLLDFEFGSIVVVHARGAPIHPVHVSVFVEFITKAMKTAPWLAQEKTRGQTVQLIDGEMLDMLVTKANFQTFWETLQSTAPYDNVINQLPSPYLYEDI